MSSIVLDLQSDALKADHPVADLLRKALVISRKLGISEIESWIKSELNGYDPSKEIPEYREVCGEVRAWSQRHGWQPVHFKNAELGEKLSRRKIAQPIGELDLLRNEMYKDGLTVPFPLELANRLMEHFGELAQPSLHVAPTQVIGILDAVKNRILEWALSLEQGGVLGEGMSFSAAEKQQASEVTYNITNNIGHMLNSQFQQHSPSAVQTLSIETHRTELSELIERIQVSISELGLDDESTTELLADIGSARAQLESPKPKPPIISGALNSIRNILEGAAGSILATELLKALSRYL